MRSLLRPKEKSRLHREDTQLLDYNSPLSFGMSYHGVVCICSIIHKTYLEENLCERQFIQFSVNPIVYSYCSSAFEISSILKVPKFR